MAWVHLSIASALIADGINEAAAKMMVSIYSDEQYGQNPDWLNYMGIVYDQPGTSVFDDKKAHDFFVRAANIGHLGAAYNLGVRWLRGVYDQIDVERARFWFQRAFELGHGCGGASFSDMLMSDPRYGDPKHADFTQMTHDILAQSEKLGGPWAIFRTATLKASGRLDGYDIEGAIERYMFLAREEVCAPPRGRAALCLSLHAFLGHSLGIDTDVALKFLNQIPAPSEQDSVLYGVSNAAERLRYIITQDLLPYDLEQKRKGQNSFALRPDHQTAYNLMSDIWSGDLTVDNAIKGINSGRIPVTQALSDRLWAQTVLNDHEWNKNSEVWQNIYRAVQLKLLGVTEHKAQISTYDFGPQYNKFDANGFPIPGTPALVSSSDSPRSATNPEKGYGKLLGLTATPTGDVSFSFGPLAEGQMPLLFPDDIDVVMALSFVNSRKVMWPSISIEDLEQQVPSRPRWSLEQKVWEPHWLSRTRIGQTLYATDYWIGNLAWRSDKFSLGRESREQAQFLLNKLALCGGRHDGMSARVMLRPTKVHWNWTREKDQSLRCQLHKVDMRVDGGNIVVFPDGTEDRNMHLNSPNYATGRVANLLTSHYDEISELWPMFERLRQITGLMYAGAELKKQGFRPGNALRERMAYTVNKLLIDAPAMPLAERLVL